VIDPVSRMTASHFPRLGVNAIWAGRNNGSSDGVIVRVS
jgi:hypothetical protein